MEPSFKSVELLSLDLSVSHTDAEVTGEHILKTACMLK